MDDLIETLEDLVERGRFALANNWTPDKLREFIGEMTGQARYAAELAKDWALVKEVECG